MSLPDPSNGAASATYKTTYEYDKASQLTKVIDALGESDLLYRVETVELEDLPKIELLDGVKTFDGAPIKPWSVTFSVGGN